MIKGEILGGDELKRRMEKAAPTFRVNLSNAIGRLVLQLQRNVKADKLSGQVLKVKTGRLRRSINSSLQGVNTERVQGTVGTNVSYARAHEYGFTGAVSVKAHMRTIKQAFGKSITPVSVQVGGHSRNVTLPERSFLRTALQDMEPRIQSELRNAVTEAVK